MELSWINGQVAEHISVLDRGYLYGDGFFTTIAFKEGVCLLKDLHLARIYYSCERLAIRLDFSQFENEFEQFLLQVPHQGCYLVKVIISREQTQRGFSVSKNASVNRVLQLSEYKDISVLKAKRENGLKLCLAPQYLSRQPLLAGIKHLSRLEHVLIANQIDFERFDEALLFDEAGNLVEALQANVLCLSGKQVFSPDLSDAGVEGVMKACIKNLLENSGYQFIECNLTKRELENMDAIFLSNCILGLVHVASIDGLNWHANLDAMEQFRKTIPVNTFVF